MSKDAQQRAQRLTDDLASRVLANAQFLGLDVDLAEELGRVARLMGNVNQRVALIEAARLRQHANS